MSNSGVSAERCAARTRAQGSGQRAEESRDAADGALAKHTPTKIVVIEQDCGRLISLLLWLDQFAEVEIIGSSSQLHEVTPLQMQNADVLIIDLENQEMQSIAAFRNLKTLPEAPATLVLCKTEASAIDKAVAAEADGIVRANAPIADLVESLRRAYNRRKIQTTAAKVPLTKAG